MKNDEIEELISALHEAGVDAQLCDTPVRQALSTAHCGDPTELGDDDASEYVMLPKSLVGMHPEMLIPVEGDSMRDAGYEPGDLLRVRFGVPAYDCDNVVALIDGKCTVKALITDEEGQRWLVPRNEEYDAILLTEEMDVRLLGVVVGYEKASTRASSRQLLAAIRRTKSKMKTAQKLSQEQIESRIVRISTEVVHARQWYAVYRALLDCDLIERGDYIGFCAMVNRVVPEHKHLPEAKEISRMAVLSFDKPISIWTENNAPVSGSRYKDYLRIAMNMKEYLGEKE